MSIWDESISYQRAVRKLRQALPESSLINVAGAF